MTGTNISSLPIELVDEDGSKGFLAMLSTDSFYLENKSLVDTIVALSEIPSYLLDLSWDELRKSLLESRLSRRGRVTDRRECGTVQGGARLETCIRWCLKL
jgi:hypothetical protein